jgi:protein TonB
MADSHAKRKAVRVGIALVVVACMLGVAFFVLKILITGNAGKRKRVVQKVTLVKPPPPPKPKEKPPEPEIKKKEELPQPEQEELPPEDMDDAMDDEAPPGEDLGLDAEGSGAGDAFGLKGNKGGRSLIGGGGGRNLLKRYAWYTGILQEEIRKKINKSLEARDDVPGGEYRMMLRIKLDDVGNIVSLSVVSSSGRQQVDTFVEESVSGLKISEVPPAKMPRAMKLKIKFKS